MSGDGGHIGWRSAKTGNLFKGTIQGTFHKILVKIGLVVSEELTKM